MAYLNVSIQSIIASTFANPTRSVADHRLNPTYDLSFWPTKWIPPLKNLRILAQLLAHRAYSSESGRTGRLMFEEKLKQFDHLYAISKNHATIDFYLISINFKQLSNTKKFSCKFLWKKLHVSRQTIT